MPEQNSINIKLDFSLIKLIVTSKLTKYAEILEIMDSNNGRYPFSATVLEYFSELGVIHWAELYFQESKQNLLQIHKKSLNQAGLYLIDQLGENPSIEAAGSFLNKFANDLANSDRIEGLEFLETPPNAELVKDLPDDEREKQRDTFIQFMVGFYNDLSLSAHGESIYSLVEKARNNDHDALTKAIQIDSSLIKYFDMVFFENQMRGNPDFFDSLAYRIKSPPRKGTNRHPLLWVFLKDLFEAHCLHSGITSNEILTAYQKAVAGFPKFYIDDEQIVQRQRRKFNRMYRQVK